jgi:hypothetical protein
MAYALLFDSLRQIFSTYDEVPVNDISVSNVVSFLMAMTRPKPEFLHPLREYVARYPNCVNEMDSNGYTPLILATRHSAKFHRDVPKIVISGYEYINKEINGMTPLGNCVSDNCRCDYNTFKLILNAGADPNKTFNGRYPLVYAATSGKDCKDKMITDLVNAGAQCVDKYADMSAETVKKIKSLVKPLKISIADVCSFCMNKRATIMNAHPSCAHVLGCDDCYMKLKKCHLCEAPFIRGIDISSVME